MFFDLRNKGFRWSELTRSTENVPAATQQLPPYAHTWPRTSAVCCVLMAVSHRSIWWPSSTATLGTKRVLQDLRHVLQILPSSINSAVHISSFIHLLHFITLNCGDHILVRWEISEDPNETCFVSYNIYEMSNKYKRSMCIRVECELRGYKTEIQHYLFQRLLTWAFQTSHILYYESDFLPTLIFLMRLPFRADLTKAFTCFLVLGAKQASLLLILGERV